MKEKDTMHSMGVAMPSMPMPRRSFLKLTGAIVGATAAIGSGLGPNLRAFTVAAAPATQSTVGEWIPTTCLGCTSWCSKEVYVLDGRAIKVRGNARSKVNGPYSCPRAHLGLQQVYDPDRVKVPMRRTNPKKGLGEDPQFVPITWDEALDEIADKIMELRENNETHKYMLMRGRYTYMRDIIYDRMTKIIGSPNNISHSALCAEADKFGPYYTEGLWDYRQYDVENTRYILLWGTDPLASNRQVSYYSSAWGDVLDRAQVVVIDPRLSTTAAKANKWLPIKPGQDGALAVAIAHVILTEGLWSREFVGDFVDGENLFVAGEEVAEEAFAEIYTSGLVKWWNLELKDKTPEWAAERTGLDAADIYKVAVGFGKEAPRSISWTSRGIHMNPRGAYAAMAAHALNGLVGSVDNVGGTLKSNKEYTQSFPAPDDFIDAIASEGKGKKKIDQRGTKAFPALSEGKSGGGVVTNNAADGILNEDPYDIKVAIAYHNNHAFSAPQTERWYRALSKIPFLVHLTTNASEFSWFADIILPSRQSMFEKWGYTKAFGHGHRHVTLLRPVIEPAWDLKSDESVIPYLLAEKLAERGFDNLLRHFQSYLDPETGQAPTSAEEFELYALKHATHKLWDPAVHEGGDKFGGWDEFVQAGVWNSAPYPYRKRWGEFGTVTKMFEFYSQTLEAALAGHAEKHETSIDDILETCNYQARGEVAFVPHYEEPYMWGEEAEYPFVFVDHRSKLNREGRSANTLWYQELRNVDPGDEAWDDVAKINPVDAVAIGVKNGDRIKIISPVGELTCTAKLWEGVRPGSVAKTYGQGHWAYGRIAALEFGVTPRGGNNNDIIPADYDRLSGSSAFSSTTRVRIEKV